MECAGLSGLWIACPPTIDGLMPDETAFFRLLGEPVVVAAVMGLVALVTLVVLTATEGLGIGPAAPALLRDADRDGALRHARSLRGLAVGGAAIRTARAARLLRAGLQDPERGAALRDAARAPGGSRALASWRPDRRLVGRPAPDHGPLDRPPIDRAA